MSNPVKQDLCRWRWKGSEESSQSRPTSGGDQSLVSSQKLDWFETRSEVKALGYTCIWKPTNIQLVLSKQKHQTPLTLIALSIVIHFQRPESLPLRSRGSCSRKPSGLGVQRWTETSRPNQLHKTPAKSWRASLTSALTREPYQSLHHSGQGYDLFIIAMEMEYRLSSIWQDENVLLVSMPSHVKTGIA